MAIEVLRRLDILMALEAVAIANWDGQNGRLDIGVGQIGGQILGAHHFTLHSPNHAFTGMTVDAADALGVVEIRQVGGRVLQASLKVRRLRLSMAGGTKGIGFLKMRAVGKAGPGEDETHGENDSRNPDRFRSERPGLRL